MSYEWNPGKANRNFQKHGIHFADAVAVFEDEQAFWQEDAGDFGEERYVAVGMDHLGHILTVLHISR